MSAFSCFDCNLVILLPDDNATNCPSCGGSRGEVINNKKVIEGLDSGAFFNFDPKTGKRAKKPKR